MKYRNESGYPESDAIWLTIQVEGGRLKVRRGFRPRACVEKIIT